MSEFQIISRAKASSLGLTRYFTGKPCIRGHIAPRFVRGICVECYKLVGKTEQFRKTAKLWRDNNKRQMKHNNLKKYGISIDAYEALLEKQRYRCAVCNDKIKSGAGKSSCSAVVDHCHSTNRVRGILCNRCNRGLGLLRDNPEILAAAISYLRSS